MESLTHVESGVGDFPYSLDKSHCSQVLNSSIVLVLFLIPVYWERSIFSIHSCRCCEYVIDFVECVQILYSGHGRRRKFYVFLPA